LQRIVTMTASASQLLAEKKTNFISYTLHSTAAFTHAFLSFFFLLHFPSKNENNINNNI
jgi:hypothetical protein